MSLMGTLAKVAIGYAAARGVDRLSGGAGLPGLLGGGAQVPAQTEAARIQAQAGRAMAGEMPKGVENPMAGMMEQFQQGGLGALMGSLGGGAGGANPLAEMMQKMQAQGIDLAAMMGGGAAQGDRSAGLLSALSAGGTGAGLAGLLAMMGGTAAKAQGQGAAAMLDALDTGKTAPDAEKAAGLMLRAMIMAAKSDGGIDSAEQAKILETVGDASAEDMAFVQAALKAPVDPQALAADTPEAQRGPVYAASLMTIRVDTEAEAQYLDRLARALQLDESTVNTLHMQMGLQPLYG
ncbi:DUF533 domain-containing protein [Thetidibacter halocola]|uniref:DUF533 domain-containing protein n=1 Tax=Thetidibacter halocola TaxID=2827239 RepID=A0A8J7W8W6_9RHOB|nr:DUF533 domain-containing protein [Thetidibacter halocola]MBS0123050.1 DUF533 domain-containing protein [Thetidibacter halocola]